MEFNIKDIVKDNFVNFDKYRQGYFYYRVAVGYLAYTFPVPLDDIGEATMLPRDKAIIFMRYIRKAIADGTFISVA